MSVSSFHSKFAKPVFWRWLLALSFGVQLLLCVPAFADMISTTPQGVSIKVDDRPLPELIQEIESNTRFRIKVPENMKEEKVTVRIEAANGKEAVELWLRDYSHIKIPDAQRGLTTIIIMRSRNAPSVIQTSQPAKAIPSYQSNISPAKQDQRRNLLRASETPAEKKLTDENVKYLSKLSPRAGEELLNDPLYRSFLRQNGIKTPQDLKDSRKIKKLWKESKRLLWARGVKTHTGPKISKEEIRKKYRQYLERNKKRGK